MYNYLKYKLEKVNSDSKKMFSLTVLFNMVVRDLGTRRTNTVPNDTVNEH